MAAVVIQQPAMTTAVVQLVPLKRDWNSNECDCCNDCAGCWFVLLCPLCFLFTFSLRMNENCLAMYCAPVAMRTKLRTENNIKGSVCDDWCSLGCCSQMIYCQMDRELKHLGR